MTSVSWLSGVFALVIGGIGLLLKGRDAWSQKSPSSLVLLIIPVFGIALLFFSALLKLRARKYSGTYFEMESVPFFLGQKLRGTVPCGGLGNISPTPTVRSATPLPPQI
jgi:hypothetical protein